MSCPISTDKSTDKSFKTVLLVRRTFNKDSILGTNENSFPVVLFMFFSAPFLDVLSSLQKVLPSHIYVPDRESPLAELHNNMLTVTLCSIQ